MNTSVNSFFPPDLLTSTVFFLLFIFCVRFILAPIIFRLLCVASGIVCYSIGVKFFQEGPSLLYRFDSFPIPAKIVITIGTMLLGAGLLFFAALQFSVSMRRKLSSIYGFRISFPLFYVGSWIAGVSAYHLRNISLLLAAPDYRFSPPDYFWLTYIGTLVMLLVGILLPESETPIGWSFRKKYFRVKRSEAPALQKQKFSGDAHIIDFSKNGLPPPPLKKRVEPLPPLPEPMTITDAFSVLGIRSSASLQEARAAYLSLIKIYHPDKVRASAEPVQRFVEMESGKLNRAYEMIERYLRREYNKIP